MRESWNDTGIFGGRRKRDRNDVNIILMHVIFKIIKENQIGDEKSINVFRITRLIEP